MGKPKKIKKKNSILFTTKHHSFTGILGTVLFGIATMVLITMVMYSFRLGGKLDSKFGYYGFILALINICGLIGGIMGVRERDAYTVGPVIAIVGNSLNLAVWAILIVLS